MSGYISQEKPRTTLNYPVRYDMQQAAIDLRASACHGAKRWFTSRLLEGSGDIQTGKHAAELFVNVLRGAQPASIQRLYEIPHARRWLSAPQHTAVTINGEVLILIDRGRMTNGRDGALFTGMYDWQQYDDSRACRLNKGLAPLVVPLIADNNAVYEPLSELVVLLRSLENLHEWINEGFKFVDDCRSTKQLRAVFPEAFDIYGFDEGRSRKFTIPKPAGSSPVPKAIVSERYDKFQAFRGKAIAMQAMINKAKLMVLADSRSAAGGAKISSLTQYMGVKLDP